jgi:anti-sigma factor RsiW
MSDCTSLDQLVTPYIDDDLPVEQRQFVERHLRVCPPCYTRVSAERAVRDLIVERKPDLGRECASPMLRARCERHGTAQRAAAEAVALTGAGNAGMGAKPRAGIAPASRLRSRLAPLALAATLVLIVGGAFTYEATALSNRVMAAELTADHVKCFAMNGMLGTHDAPAAVEQSMMSGFGWHLSAVERFEEAGLSLVGSRPCLYGGGKVAHMMFHHDGRPVSVFMLPGTVRAEEVVDVMGHEAAIWSAGGRTFVMIARAPRFEAEQMASMVQAALR